MKRHVIVPSKIQRKAGLSFQFSLGEIHNKSHMRPDSSGQQIHHYYFGIRRCSHDSKGKILTLNEHSLFGRLRTRVWSFCSGSCGFRFLLFSEVKSCEYMKRTKWKINYQVKRERAWRFYFWKIWGGKSKS